MHHIRANAEFCKDKYLFKKKKKRLNGRGRVNEGKYG
jgi:hypothetical protein